MVLTFCVKIIICGFENSFFTNRINLYKDSLYLEKHIKNNSIQIVFKNYGYKSNKSYI